METLIEERPRIRKLTSESIPCWYEISFQPAPDPAILLRIHEGVSEIPQQHIFVTHFTRSRGYQPFQFAYSGDLGFGGVIKRTGYREGFHEFTIPLPQIRKESGRCIYCEGPGAHCLYCEGTGIHFSCDYDGVKPLIATLSIVFDFLRSTEWTTDTGRPQVFAIVTGTEHGGGGSFIAGDFGIELVEWIRTLGTGTMPAVAQTVQIAWNWIMRDRTDPFLFPSQISNGYFHQDCPGNACGVDPDDGYCPPGEGYRFGSHNMDTPAQQLAMLAGLAKLHDLFRAASAA